MEFVANSRSIRRPKKMLAQRAGSRGWIIFPYIVEGQLSRATVWGINYPVLTSGRIRLTRTHADYTVLSVVHGSFVSRDAFNQSGRIHVIRL